VAVSRAANEIARNGDAMPTRAAFDQQFEDVLGAGTEDYGKPAAAIPGSGYPAVDLTLHDDLKAIENEWRAFEERADCTVFQTFDWLSAWLRHIGVREGGKPVVVIGRYQGAILFVMPFAFHPDGRKIGWLGTSLCNYNGPLLARDFSRQVSPAQFLKIWSQVRRLLRSAMGYDVIDLEKMPDTIGEQPNPFCALAITPHVNNAYIATLSGDWETFYAAKRSSNTRRSDRKKQRRLAECGEVRFLTAAGRDEVERTLDVLIEEKTASYAKLGVDNMFNRPGYRDFFLDLATGAQSARLAHLSRLDVGNETAAANFGLGYRGTYISLLAGYNDGELGRFGPGSLQLLEMFQYAFDRGLKTFDFTIGDEPYKRDWFDIEMKLYDHAAAATLRGWMTITPARTMRAIKRVVRQNPTIWSIVRKARMTVSSLRR
jgi:CelD/BcsL family acetyltransferase involved in cellulose biosynthesis